MRSKNKLATLYSMPTKKSKQEIEMVSVSSSNLSAVGYDAEKKLLRVKFNAGATYEYRGVPETVYDDLMSADSHGEYFAANVRNSFPYTKV